jgi:hypothetical protein
MMIIPNFRYLMPGRKNSEQTYRTGGLKINEKQLFFFFRRIFFPSGKSCVYTMKLVMKSPAT